MCDTPCTDIGDPESRHEPEATPARALVVSEAGEPVTDTLTPTPTEALVLHAIDDMLRLAELVRVQRHRDPIRALENLLLDMRQQIATEP